MLESGSDLKQQQQHCIGNCCDSKDNTSPGLSFKSLTAGKHDVDEVLSAK